MRSLCRTTPMRTSWPNHVTGMLSTAGFAVKVRHRVFSRGLPVPNIMHQHANLKSLHSYFSYASPPSTFQCPIVLSLRNSSQTLLSIRESADEHVLCSKACDVNHCLSPQRISHAGLSQTECRKETLHGQALIGQRGSRGRHQIPTSVSTAACLPWAAL